MPGWRTDSPREGQWGGEEEGGGMVTAVRLNTAHKAALLQLPRPQRSTQPLPLLLSFVSQTTLSPQRLVPVVLFAEPPSSDLSHTVTVRYPDAAIHSSNCAACLRHTSRSRALLSAPHTPPSQLRANRSHCRALLPGSCRTTAGERERKKEDFFNCIIYLTLLNRLTPFLLVVPNEGYCHQKLTPQ